MEGLAATGGDFSSALICSAHHLGIVAFLLLLITASEKSPHQAIVITTMHQNFQLRGEGPEVDTVSFLSMGVVFVLFTILIPWDTQLYPRSSDRDSNRFLPHSFPRLPVFQKW